MSQHPPTEPEPDELDPRELLACELFAAGRTNAEAAEALGVSVSTAKRLKERPAVQARVRRLQMAAVNEVSAVLLAGGRDAAEQLLRLGKVGTKDDVVRLRAVIATIECVHKYAAVASLEAQVLELRANQDRIEALQDRRGSGDRVEDGQGGPLPPDPEPSPDAPDCEPDAEPPADPEARP